jgi:hypothetical protein
MILENLVCILRTLNSSNQTLPNMTETLHLSKNSTGRGSNAQAPSKNSALGWLFLFSFCLGSVLLFQNTNLHLSFDGNMAYPDFAENVFKKNTSYFTESILVAVLAKVLGASVTIYAYKILCVILTVSILPVLSIAALAYFGKVSAAVVFVLLLALIFPWFRTANLADPDPVTIMLIMLAMLQKKPHLTFWAIFFASLSHISLVLMTVPTIVVFIFATRFQSWSQKLNFIKFVLLALLCGKAFIHLWYFIFDYQLYGSRIGWVLERYPDFFIERYQSSPAEFWLTPTLVFLITYGLIGCYFLSLHRYSFVLAMILSLMCAYLANFITIDGFRIVAVTLSATCACIAKELVSVCDVQIQTLCDNTYKKVSKLASHFFIHWPDILAVTALMFGWASGLKIASSHGLLLNTLMPVSFYSVQIDPKLILFTIAIVFNVVVLLSPQLRRTKFGKAAQVVFLMPFVLMSIQYFRQMFFFNQPLSVVGQVIVALVLLSTMVLCARLSLTAPFFDGTEKFIRRLFATSIN